MINTITGTFIGLVLFLGCGGVSDAVEKLSNKYVYMDESNTQKFIMFEGGSSLIEQEKNYIPCQILKYKDNKNYIIAQIKFHYEMGFVVGFEESKKLKEGQIYYYIIDTNKNVRYGPFEDKEIYMQQKKALNIKIKL
jgi:hypothetical protein